MRSNYDMGVPTTGTPAVKVTSPAREALDRALRTFLQAFLGTFVLVAFPVLTSIVSSVSTGDPLVIDYNFFGRVLIACGISGVVAVVSYLQNLLENTSGHALVSKLPAEVNVKPDSVPTREVK